MTSRTLSRRSADAYKTERSGTARGSGHSGQTGKVYKQSARTGESGRSRGSGTSQVRVRVRGRVRVGVRGRVRVGVRGIAG